MSTQPEIDGLRQLMTMWTNTELDAFFRCIRPDDSVSPPTEREELISRSVEELFWAHNSRVKAEASYTAPKLAVAAYEQLPEAMKTRVSAPSPVKPLHEYASPLSYETLLRGPARS